VHQKEGEKGRKRGAGVLFGRTCDSLDVIAKSADMEELEVGDWLWFPSMGAYTRATASEFNGFPTPAVFETNDREETDLKDHDIRWGIPRGVERVAPMSVRSLFA
jgi:hypothetical protein